MMKNREFKVVISETEYKAMAWDCYDVKRWIDNLVHNKARRCMDSIAALETQRIRREGTTNSMPVSVIELVDGAKLQTAKERHIQALAERLVEKDSDA